jgi:hypothetical protein
MKEGLDSLKHLHRRQVVRLDEEIGVLARVFQAPALLQIVFWEPIEAPTFCARLK